MKVLVGVTPLNVLQVVVACGVVVVLVLPYPGCLSNIFFIAAQFTYLYELKSSSVIRAGGINEPTIKSLHYMYLDPRSRELFLRHTQYYIYDIYSPYTLYHRLVICETFLFARLELFHTFFFFLILTWVFTPETRSKWSLYQTSCYDKTY